jgi:gliding motility-associated-like protein
MKKFFFAALSILLAATNLLAQAPVNDECATAIDLGIAPACDTNIVYSNDNATLSNIGDDNNPTCFNGGIPNRDVWFSFVCPDTLFDFRISVAGTGGLNGIQNPQVAIYRGDCTFNDLFELSCAIADIGENEVFIDLNGLTPGVTYYIRISDYSATGTPNSGEFTLCVDKVPEIVTINQGSSTQCSGTITDSGGIDGDYGPNEEYTFTICPNQLTSCITFTLDYYNMEESFTDGLYFYDGPNANAPLLTVVQAQPDFGTSPTGASGGVALTVQGSQPCMTLVFLSDDMTEFEGFLGHWECSSLPCPAPNTIAIESPIDNSVIVNAVTSPATQVTITDIVCDETAYGAFSYPTTNNDLQMTKGIVLSSGTVSELSGIGFNFASNVMNTPGDNDLDILSFQQGGQESYDACVVEMDVFVATNQLEFEYVFGSEEYPEYVFSPGGFNDIFAFLVSGPGIVGEPGLSGQKNIAVVPGTGTPVEINTVNDHVNWQYYRNNENGTELVLDGLTSDFQGIKKSLTAKTTVIPCNTYHLKLAVADRGDFSFDSGVFISEIKGGTPGLEVLFASGIDYFVEDCSGTQDQLIITLPDALPEATTFITGIGGTATLGLDYILNLPPTITFPAGVTSLSFPIYPLTDALVEGTETIEISLSSNFGCGTVLLKTITVNLEDQLVVNVNAGADTVFVCSGVEFELSAAGAQSYFWSPPSAVSNPGSPNPTITTTQDIWLSVTGTLATCVDVDSVFVKVIAPTVEAGALGNTSICLGSSVQLNAINNVDNQGLTWSPAVGLNNPSAQQPIASPKVTTVYTATIKLGECTVTDQITVNVDTLFAPVLIADTTICENYTVTLASEVLETTNYQWTPQGELSSNTISNPLAFPSETTTYTLVSTSANGFCSSSQSVTVTVIPADIDISGPQKYEICLGTTIPLQAIAAPAGGSVVQWSPAFYLSTATGPTTVVNTDESFTLFATYTVNGCKVTDSVQITVDSLPDLSLSLRPVKDIYCPGDTVTLFSTTYEPASFPFIKNTWLPDGLGQVTPDSLWNMVIRAQVTDTFTRITKNRGCLDTASIVVPVDVLPVVSITSNKPAACQGEAVLLSATVSPDQKLEWSPAAQLSCTDCTSPSATITATTTFSVTTPEANCPAGASITIEMLPRPTLAVPPNTTVCAGTGVLLNNQAAEPNTTYAWISNPPGFTSTEAQPTTTPTVTTTYTVTASNPGCTSSGSITIDPATATVNAGLDQEACVGTTFTLNASAGNVVGSYEWFNGGVSLSNNQQTLVTAATSGTYQVVFTYGGPAQCVTTDEVNINVNPTPFLSSIVLNPADFCEGERIVLQSNVVNGTAPYSYTWTLDGAPFQPGATDSIAISLPAEANGENRTYEINVSVTDAKGCTDGPEQWSISVRDCFALPNAFTPGNGDDINPTFGPVYPDGAPQLPLSKFVIYNRWGNVVFRASSTVKAWDGLIDGKLAPMDVYVYQIIVQRPDGSEKSYTGEVTLIR